MTTLVQYVRAYRGDPVRRRLGGKQRSARRVGRRRPRLVQGVMGRVLAERGPVAIGTLASITTAYGVQHVVTDPANAFGCVRSVVSVSL